MKQTLVLFTTFVALASSLFILSYKLYQTVTRWGGKGFSIINLLPSSKCYSFDGWRTYEGWNEPHPSRWFLDETPNDFDIFQRLRSSSLNYFDIWKWHSWDKLSDVNFNAKKDIWLKKDNKISPVAATD